MAPSLPRRHAISKDTIARSEAITAEYASQGATLDSTFIKDQLPPLDPTSCPNHPSSLVEIVNSDSFTAARNIIKRFPEAANSKVGVLNLASDELPGGGWDMTLSKTQEEALCYSSTLFKTLKPEYYPWPNLGPASIAGVFSPGIVIFKDDLDHNCEDLDGWRRESLKFSATTTMLGRVLRTAVRHPRALRSYATHTAGGPLTQISTLRNGLTVATESHPHAETATVGVWIDAGSRAENATNNGTAHFLEHMAFKGTGRRTQHALELEVENIGAHLNAYTSREQTVYYAKSFKKDVPVAVDIISDILQNSKLESSAVERERDVILREQQEVDKQLEEVVFDHLHAVAFQGQPLGRTILGPQKNILSIKRDDLSTYIKTNYTADRMVLVGTGGVSHESLVQLAEKHFSSLPSSANPLPLGSSSSKVKPAFVGSEVRIRDDTIPTANIAIAVEGVGWSSPDYFPMMVMQSIFGNWDRSLGASPLLSSRLSHIISSNNLANSFMSFSTSYSDTGLWGIYLVSENLMCLDDLMKLTLKEWQRMSIAPTEVEVERAKSQLKAGLLLSLDGTTAIAEDIGRQLVTTGRRMTPAQLENAVDAVSVDDIKRVAQKYLWDKDFAMAALGSIDGLLDYYRIRTDMSSMLH